MLLGSAFGRAVLGAAMVFVLATGCGRWLPAKSLEVTSEGAPEGRYAAVVEVAKAEKYTIVSQDPSALRLRLQAKANAKSFIDIEVGASAVKLAGAGHLVRDDKVHKSLNTELVALEKKLAVRLGAASAGSASAKPAAPAIAAPATAATPPAWSEPASDPAVWGPGNFTCLPVHVPAWAPIAGITVSCGIGLVFGMWPAMKAAKLDPIDALRYE